VYFTTDGSDPYIPPTSETTTLVGEEAAVSVLVPSVDNGGAALDGSWRDVAAPGNAGEWIAGTNGVGYETTPEAYADLIQTEVASMYQTNGSVFIRIPFEIPDAAALTAIQKLTLSMRYDDGFVAYLNGVRVAEANAPADPLYNSAATANQPDALAVAAESFDLSGSLGALQVGSNLLAIQGLNDRVTSSDLLILAVLEAGREQAGGPSPGATVYSGPVALGRSGVVRARAVSAAGEWSPLTEARFIYGIPASSANLVISEIAYRPAGPSTAAEIDVGVTDRSAFEFIEVTNVSANRINLAGVRFTAGVEFDFTGTPAATLDAGLSAVVVANAEAFGARYVKRSLVTLAGDFTGLTRLANEGELVQLTAADGSVIQSFAYDDKAPWPEAADGLGFTLELIDPASRPDPANPQNWRASLDIGGTPGGLGLDDFDAWTRRYFDPAAPDFAARSAPAADPDGDGLVNRWEYLLASPPTSSNGSGLRTGLVSGEGASYLWIEADLRPGTADTVRAETSANLTEWSAAGTLRVEDVPQPSDGRERVRFRTVDPVSPVGRYLRLAF
jgi:hypothetical protein